MTAYLGRWDALMRRIEIALLKHGETNETGQPDRELSQRDALHGYFADWLDEELQRAMSDRELLRQLLTEGTQEVEGQAPPAPKRGKRGRRPS